MPDVKMRHPYYPNHSNTQKLFQQSLHNDLGVYSVQRGGGLGGFLKSAFSKFIIPMGRSMVSKGFEMAKPELKRFAQKGITAAADYGVKQINSKADQLFNKVGGKRPSPRTTVGVPIKRLRTKNTPKRRKDTLS